MKPRIGQLAQSGAADQDVITWDDTLGQWVPQAGTAGYSDEQARDAIGLALVEGTGIDITVSDGSDTITIAATGGGGGYNPIPLDNPANWTTDEGYDYEFNATTTSLPSGWSWLNQGGASYTEQFGGGIIVGTSQGGDSVRAVQRSLPAGSVWTALAKLSPSVGPANFSDGGIILRQSSDGKFYNFGFTSGATMLLNHWSSPTVGVNADVSEISRIVQPRYLKVAKSSATSWAFYYSSDGLSWRALTSGFNPTYCTPDQIGFYTNANGGGSNEIACQWFRLRTSATYAGTDSGSTS